MDPGFDNLESSLKFEDSLLGQSGTIDTLCHTYLANMDSFPSSSASSPRGDYGAEGGYGASYRDDLKTFTSRNVRDWDGEECLEWAESVCEQLGLERTSLDLWSFKTTTGSNLLQLSQENFSQLLGPRFGQVFYSQLRALSNRKGTGKTKSRHRQQEAEDPSSSSSIFTSGHDVSSVVGTSYDYAAASCDPTSPAYDPDSWELTSEDFKELDRYIPDDSWDPLTENLEGLDLQEQFMPIKYEEETWAAAAMTPTATPTATPETDVFQKIPTNTRRRERGPKSWEFLLRLLEDRRSNPALIRWEDEANGTFRLVQPNVIAQMWGARSEKPNLSYFNFARGLRLGSAAAD
nr:ETS homologous factor-like isoform X2 [Procambarus clarkii]